jgi:hypothetical protein
MLDDPESYLRSEVMAVTGGARGEIQGLLDSGVVLPDRPRDRTLLRWPSYEIPLASIALKLARAGILLASIRPAIDAARRELQAGPPAVMMIEFDAAGRFTSAARVDGVVPLGDLSEPSETSSGFRLLINVAAEARNIEAKLRAHRADHGVVRRGPKTCRKSA